MQWIFLALVTPFIVSCSNIKPYPVCFYDGSPLDAQSKITHADKLLAVMRLYDQEAQTSADGRWILANTTTEQHNILIKTWPRIACIGKVTSGTEVKHTADCVEYLHNFLLKQNYLEFDVNENVVFSDEAPGKPNVICHRDP